MLFEALRHFFTRAPRHVKGLGFLRESIAIEAREKRCPSYWQPHLDKTKSLILEDAQKRIGRGRVIVLGAGNLLDVPLDRLTGMGEQIDLVDILFLRRAKRRVRPYENATLISKDITGMAEFFWQWSKMPERYMLPPVIEPDFSDLADAGLVISLNILSQLPLPYSVWMEKNQWNDGNEDFLDKIMTRHVNALIKLRVPVLMIADIEHLYLEDNEVIGRHSALPKDFSHAPFATWDWDIAPKGEADKNIAIRHSVGAWHF
jgi:hypothetical protein